MTKLAIIRHGSTQWNKEKRAQGKADIPLDEEGRADADKLANRLNHKPWDVIYSSPLKRAKQTAQIIATQLGMEIIYDPRLQEVDGGQIEGTTEDERVKKWGEDWRQLDLGIEKTDLVLKRSKEFVKEICDTHPRENVLIVSHGSLISHLLKELDPNKIKKEHMKNTSLTEMIFQEGKWDCQRFNCTLHLEE